MPFLRVRHRHRYCGKQYQDSTWIPLRSQRCIRYWRIRTNALASQGKLYVRGDSKIFRFQNGKTESLFLQRKNPRRISWTVLFRRQHKKGISEVRTTWFLHLMLHGGMNSGMSARKHHAKPLYRRSPRSAHVAPSSSSVASLAPLST